MKLQRITLEKLSRMICGDEPYSNFPYRSSSFLTSFFQAIDLDYVHDGSTRFWWVLSVLTELNNQQESTEKLPSENMIKVVEYLADPDHFSGHEELSQTDAILLINEVLRRYQLQIIVNRDTGIAKLSSHSGNIKSTPVSRQKDSRTISFSSGWLSKTIRFFGWLIPVGLTVFIVFNGNGICNRYTLPLWIEDTFCLWAENALPPESNSNTGENGFGPPSTATEPNDSYIIRLDSLFSEFNGLIRDNKQDIAYQYLHTDRYKSNWEYSVFVENWINLCVSPILGNIIYLSDDYTYTEVWTEIYFCNDTDQSTINSLRACIKEDDGILKFDEWIITIDYECPY